MNSTCDGQEVREALFGYTSAEDLVGLRQRIESRKGRECTYMSVDGVVEDRGKNVE